MGVPWEGVHDPEGSVAFAGADEGRLVDPPQAQQEQGEEGEVVGGNRPVAQEDPWTGVGLGEG